MARNPASLRTWVKRCRTAACLHGHDLKPGIFTTYPLIGGGCLWESYTAACRSCHKELEIYSYSDGDINFEQTLDEDCPHKENC